MISAPTPRPQKRQTWFKTLQLMQEGDGLLILKLLRDRVFTSRTGSSKKAAGDTVFHRSKRVSSSSTLEKAAVAGNLHLPYPARSGSSSESVRCPQFSREERSPVRPLSKEVRVEGAMAREKVYHRRGKGNRMDPGADLFGGSVAAGITCCRHGNRSAAKKDNSAIHVLPVDSAKPFTGRGRCEMDGVDIQLLDRMEKINVSVSLGANSWPNDLAKCLARCAQSLARQYEVGQSVGPSSSQSDNCSREAGLGFFIEPVFANKGPAILSTHLESHFSGFSNKEPSDIITAQQLSYCS
ncbi:hypothetical protein MRB53_015868 [Persea americana]|uniref:Uncharacterized protein n=1 Tax=Persea americana TaxID=3435 RepID=A0ACC2M0E7_PERAE|nr:hypothetical protein MRB53_015868 [Persea americana]